MDTGGSERSGAVPLDPDTMVFMGFHAFGAALRVGLSLRSPRNDGRGVIVP
jgi:hypothetical protein